MDWGLVENEDVEEVFDRPSFGAFSQLTFGRKELSIIDYDTSSTLTSASQEESDEEHQLESQSKPVFSSQSTFSNKEDEAYETQEDNSEDVSQPDIDIHDSQSEHNEQEEENVSQLERDLLAACNGLRPMSIGDDSVLKAQCDTVLILTKETFLNLTDVETLLRQTSYLDQNGERSFAVESLLLNSKYKLLESSFMPLWVACLDTENEAEYLEKLIFVFARVLVLPDKAWKYKNNPYRVRSYIESYTSVKPLFLKPVFWKGLSNVMHRLFLEMKNEARSAQDEEQRQQLFKEKDGILEGLKEYNEYSQRLRDINDEIHDIEARRVKRYESLKNQMLSLKTLVLCVMRLAIPSDPYYSISLSSQITTYRIWDLFEAEWRVLVSPNVLLRSRRTPSITASLWRVLDFYGRLFHELSPVLLLSPFTTPDNSTDMTYNTHSTPFAKLATTRKSTFISHRHTRFNPWLLRQRVSNLEGKYTALSKKDKLPRATPTRQRCLKRSERFSGPLLPDIYDVCLRPLAQPTPSHIARNTFSSLFHEEKKKLLLVHLHSFIRVGLNPLVTAWIDDCIAEDESLDEYDLYKVMNFMSWVLNFERHYISSKVRDWMEVQKTTDTASNNLIIKDIVSHALSLRSLLDSHGIFFVYKSFHTLFKKNRLANKTDFLLKLCLRTIVEQLYFGLSLMQDVFSATAEALKVVGRCVVEDLFKCNVIYDLVTLLRLMNPSIHDPDLIYYSYEATFIFIHAFAKLGGSASIAFGRGKRITNYAKLSNISRRVELVEFLEQLADGRILKTIIRCLRQYRLHQGQVNQCIARLLMTILRDHGRPNARHILGLCFQLSYFDIFFQILQDQTFRLRADSMELIQSIQWIVEQFWDVFSFNKFVVVELLFPKSETSPTVPFTFSDPNVLLSVFTNYDKGLDSEYLTAMEHPDDFQHDLAEWKRQHEVNLRAQRTAWTSQETRQLLHMWDLKKQFPHVIRLIRRSMKSKRSLREIQNHLVHLGVLELDPDVTETTTRDSPYYRDSTLLQSIISFCGADGLSFSLSSSQSTQFSPRGAVLLHIQTSLNDVIGLKRNNSSPSRDLVLPLDEALIRDACCIEDISDVMKALGATPQQIPSDKVNSVSSSDILTWFIPHDVTAQDMESKVKALEYYLSLSPEDLRRIAINDDTTVQPGIRLFEHLSKLRIVTVLSLIKHVESTFKWSDTDALQDQMYWILRSSDEARVTLLGIEPQWGSLEKKESLFHEHFSTFSPFRDFNTLAFPEGVSCSSLVSAIAAGLDHLARKRRQFIQYHASSIPSDQRIPLGQLVFPDQTLNTAFQHIVDFIKFSQHPLLAKLLQSVGFQPQILEKDTIMWILPLHHTLERIHTDLHLLRTYALSNATLLTQTLKRLSTFSTKPRTNESPSTSLRECPLLVVQELDEQAYHYIATASYKLRALMQKGGLETSVMAELQRIMDYVTSVCSNTEDDNDLFIHVATEEEEEQQQQQQDETANEDRISKFRSIHEFQHFLISILGRYDNELCPTLWFWSKGTSREIIDTCLTHAKTCLSSPLKMLKKYAKRRIKYDELASAHVRPQHSSSTIVGSGGRADITQYDRSHVAEHESIPLQQTAHENTAQMEKTPTVPVDSVSSMFVPPCGGLPTENPFATSLLDENSVLNQFLHEATKDLKAYKAKTSKAVEEEIRQCIASLETLNSKHDLLDNYF